MISIVIPTLNEAAHLPDLLARLADEPTPHDVVVIDGGSDDGTQAIVQDAGVPILHARPGRGHQLALGAQATSGDVLLFLHADSRFPPGGLDAIARALADDPGCPGGNFRLVFDGDSPFALWLTAFYAWFRARGLYYGDSGVFVRRSVFDEIGGIRPIDLMEDFDFTRRLERTGPTCCLDEPPLVTSSRRFDGRHPVAIVMGWLLLHGLYYLKVPPRLLAKNYAWQNRRSRQALSQHNGVDG